MRADVKINTRSGIEVVITGLTRNQLYLRVPWVRIPPTPPENSVCKRFLPFAGFFFFLSLWDFSMSSLLKIGSSLLNFLRFELWICSWRILSLQNREKCRFEPTFKKTCPARLSGRKVLISSDFRRVRGLQKRHQNGHPRHSCIKDSKCCRPKGL